MFSFIKKLFKRKGEDPVRIEVHLRSPTAKQPYSLRATDAGWDVYSLVDTEIAPGDIVSINTGMAVVAPAGYYFSVEGRSSLYKAGVVPFRGIIDGGYEGDLTITLMNVSNEKYFIMNGDRIAQLILHKIIDVDMVSVDKISPEYSIRQYKGHGSSGR